MSENRNVEKAKASGLKSPNTLTTHPSPSESKRSKVLELPPLPETYHEFVWRLDGQSTKGVRLVGSWDDWQWESPMQLVEGAFRVLKALPPGTYEYKFIVNGDWKVDERLPRNETASGHVNNVLTVRAPKLIEGPSGHVLEREPLIPCTAGTSSTSYLNFGKVGHFPPDFLPANTPVGWHLPEDLQHITASPPLFPLSFEARSASAEVRQTTLTLQNAVRWHFSPRDLTDIKDLVCYIDLPEVQYIDALVFELGLLRPWRGGWSDNEMGHPYSLSLCYHSNSGWIDYMRHYPISHLLASSQDASATTSSSKSDSSSTNDSPPSRSRRCSVNVGIRAQKLCLVLHEDPEHAHLKMLTASAASATSPLPTSLPHPPSGSSSSSSLSIGSSASESHGYESSSSEGPSELPKLRTHPLAQPISAPWRKQFKFSGEHFDQSGLLYWLGTNEGREAHWENPALTGKVGLEISHSKMTNSTMSKANILARQTVEPTFFGGTAPTFFTIDLGSYYRFSPNFYTLRHGHSSPNSFISDWSFQGSLDGHDWVTLHSQEEPPFTHGFDIRSFAVPQLPEYFRYFRIIMNGNYSMVGHTQAMAQIWAANEAVKEAKAQRSEMVKNALSATPASASDPSASQTSASQTAASMDLAQKLTKPDVGAPFLCIAGFEMYGELSTVQQKPSSNLLTSMGLSLRSLTPVESEDKPLYFKHATDFDTNGALYYLATNAGADPYVNPSESGLVQVNLSHPSVYNATMSKHNIIAHNPQKGNTFWGGTSPQWFVVDLRSKRMKPTAYTLRHGFGAANSFLRDWEFAASHDAQTWTTLHSGTSTPFNKGFDTDTWEVATKDAEPFRYFRVLQRGNYYMGPDSEGAPYMCIAGFELYGEMTTATMPLPVDDSPTTSTPLGAPGGPSKHPEEKMILDFVGIQMRRMTRQAMLANADFHNRLLALLTAPSTTTTQRIQSLELLTDILSKSLVPLGPIQANLELRAFFRHCLLPSSKIFSSRGSLSIARSSSEPSSRSSSPISSRTPTPPTPTAPAATTGDASSPSKESLMKLSRLALHFLGDVLLVPRPSDSTSHSSLDSTHRDSLALETLEVLLSMISNHEKAFDSPHTVEVVLDLLPAVWKQDSARSHSVCTAALGAISDLISENRSAYYNILRTHYKIFDLVLERRLFNYTRPEAPVLQSFHSEDPLSLGEQTSAQLERTLFQAREKFERSRYSLCTLLDDICSSSKPYTAFKSQVNLLVDECTRYQTLIGAVASRFTDPSSKRLIETSIPVSNFSRWEYLAEKLLKSINTQCGYRASKRNDKPSSKPKRSSKKSMIYPFSHSIEYLMKIFSTLCVYSTPSVRAQAIRFLAPELGTYNSFPKTILASLFSKNDIHDMRNLFDKETVFKSVVEMLSVRMRYHFSDQLFELIAHECSKPLESTPETSSKETADPEILLWTVLLLSHLTETNNEAPHSGSTCRACNSSPIRGTRYRCANCIDYDICEQCEADPTRLHDAGHVFVKIDAPLPLQPSLSRTPTSPYKDPLLLSVLYDHANELLSTWSDSSAVHTNVNCNSCGTTNITGPRFKCCQCENFNICEACDQRGAWRDHLPMHLPLKIYHPLPQSVSSKALIPVLLHRGFYPSQDNERSSKTSKKASFIPASPNDDEEVPSPALAHAVEEIEEVESEPEPAVEHVRSVSEHVGSLRNPVARRVPITSPGMLLSVSDYLEGPSATTAWASPVPMPMGPRDSEASALPHLSPREDSMVQSAYIERTTTKQTFKAPSRKMSLDNKSPKPQLTSTLKPTPGILKHSRTEDSLEKRMRQSRTDEEQSILKKETILAQKRRQTLLALQLLSRAIRIRPASSDLVSLTCRITAELAKQQDAKEFLEDLASIVADESFMEAACALDPVIQSTILNLMEEVLSTDTFLGHGVQEVHIALRAAVDKFETFLIGLLLHTVHATHITSTDALIFVETQALVLKLLLSTSSRSAFYRNATREEPELPRSASVTMSTVTPISYTVVSVSPTHTHFTKSGSSDKLASSKVLELHPHSSNQESRHQAIPKIALPPSAQLMIKAPQASHAMHPSTARERDPDHLSQPIRHNATVDSLVEPLLSILCALPLATFAEAQHWTLLLKLIGSASPRSIALCSHRFIAAFRTTLICTAPYHKIVQAEMSSILYALSDEEDTFATISVQLFETLMRETALRLVGPTPATEKPSQIYVTCIAILEKCAHLSNTSLWSGYPTFAAETARFLMAVAFSLGHQPRASPSYALALTHVAMDLLTCFMSQPACMAHAKSDTVALLLRKGKSHPTSVSNDATCDIPIAAIVSNSLTPEEESSIPIAVFLIRLLAHSDSFTDASRAEWHQFDDDLIKFLLHLTEGADGSALSLANMVFDEVTSPFLTTDSSRTKLVHRLLMPLLAHGEKVIERFASGEKVLERLLKSAAISEPTSARLPASFTRAIALDDSTYLGMAHDYGAKYARKGRQISTTAVLPTIDGFDNLGTLIRLVDPQDAPFSDMIRAAGLLGGEKGQHSAQIAPSRPLPPNLPESWKLEIEEDAEDYSITFEFQAPVLLHEVRLTFNTSMKIPPPSDVALEQGVSVSLLLPSVVSRSERKPSKRSTVPTEEWIISTDSREFIRFLRLSFFGTAASTLELSQVLVLGHISSDSFSAPVTDARYTNSVSLTRQTALASESYLPIESSLAITKLILKKSDKFANAIANNARASGLLMRLLGPCNLTAASSRDFDDTLCSLIRHRPSLADQVLRRAISGDLLFRNIRITQAIIFAPDSSNPDSVANRLHVVFETALKVWNEAERESSTTSNYARLLPFIALVGLIFQQSMHVWEPGTSAGSIPIDFVRMLVCMSVSTEERIRTLSTSVLAALCRSNPAFFPIALQHAISDAVIAKTPPQRVWRMLGTLVLTAPQSATALLEAKMLDSYVTPLVTLANLDLESAGEPSTVAIIRDVVLTQSLPLFTLLAHSPHIQTLMGPFLLESTMSLLRVTRPGTQLHDRLLELCDALTAHHPSNTSLLASLFSKDYLSSVGAADEESSLYDTQGAPALRVLSHLAAVQPMVCWSLSVIDGEDAASLDDSGASDERVASELRASTHQQFSSLERIDMPKLDTFRCNKYLKCDEMAKTVTNITQPAGWRTAVCTNSLTGSSVYYWEVTLVKLSETGNAIIGVCEADHELSGWIGQTPAHLGWSFHGSAGGSKAYTYHSGAYNSNYGRPMKQGDVVGVLVDLVQGELSFFINGQSLGVAFTNLTRQTLAPAVSLIESGDSVCFSSPIYVLHTDSLLHGNHLIAKRLDPIDPRLALRQDSGSFGFVEYPAFDSLPELRDLHSLLPDQVLTKKSAHPTFMRPLFESPACTTFKSIKQSILASVPDSDVRRCSRVTLGLFKPRKGSETELERFEELGDELDFGEVWRRIKPSSRDCIMDLSFQLEIKEEEEYDEFDDDYEGSESSPSLSSPKARRPSLHTSSPMAPLLSSLQDIGTLDSALSLAMRTLSRLQFDSNAALVLPHASAPHGYLPVAPMNSNSLLSPAYRDMQLLVLAAPGMRKNFNTLFKASAVGDSPKTTLSKNGLASPSDSDMSDATSSKEATSTTSTSNGSNSGSSSSESTSKADIKMPHVRILPIGAWISFITLLRPLLTVDGYFALFRQNPDCVTLLLQILEDCQLKSDSKQAVRRQNGFDCGLRAQASKPIWSNPTEILFEVLQEVMECSISLPKDEARTAKAVALRNAVATGPVLSTVLGVLSDASGLPPLDPTHKSFKKVVKSAEVRRGLAEKLSMVPKTSSGSSSSSTQSTSGATSQAEDPSKKTSWAKGTGYGSVGEGSGQKKNATQDSNDYTSSTTEIVPLLSFLISFLRIFPSRTIGRPIGSPDISPRADLNETQPALCTEAYEILLSSCLVPVLDSLLRNDSLLDMGKQHRKYEAAFELTALFLAHPTLMSHFDEPFSANSKTTLRSSLGALNHVISAAQKKLTTRFRNPSQREASPSILAPTAHSTRHASMLLPSPGPSPTVGPKSPLHSSGRHSRTGIVATQPARRRRNSSFHGGGSRSGSRTGSMGMSLRKSGNITPNAPGGSRSGSSVSFEESNAIEEQARLISWVFSLEDMAVQRVDSIVKKQPPIALPEESPTASPAPAQETSKESYEQQLNDYIETLGPLQFDEMEMCEDDGDYLHHYYRQQLAEDQQSSAAKMKWLTHEIGSLAVGLPLHLTSSVFLRVDQYRIDCMKVAITGPSGTPYDSGVFIFDLYCPPDYPRVPPLVNLQTTGLGSVRFNPNLYNNGKVCLSLLGTWPGGADEMWRENESTLLQVFVSIQSLIFIDEPYFNEPGFEAKLGTRAGRIDSDLYNETIRAATLRWAILEHLKSPPLGFESLITEHFKHRRVEIMRTCRSWLKDAKGSPTVGYEEKLIKLVTEVRALLQALEPFEEAMEEAQLQAAPSKPAEVKQETKRGPHRDPRWNAAISLHADFPQFEMSLIYKALELSKDQQNEAVDWLFENGETFLAANPSLKGQSPPDDYES